MPVRGNRIEQGYPGEGPILVPLNAFLPQIGQGNMIGFVRFL